MINQKDGCFGYLQNWYLDFKPSTITFYNMKTGARIVEPSYVAVKIQRKLSPPSDRSNPASAVPLGQPFAVGKEALSYQNTQDVMVFSPFRQGQLANYGMSIHFFKTFLKQIAPNVAWLKPVVCLRAQEYTTDVEERALVDAGLQAGAGRVFLYTGPLSALLTQIPKLPKNSVFKNAIIIDIEPQD